MPESWKEDPIPAYESDISSNLTSSISSVGGLSQRNRYLGAYLTYNILGECVNSMRLQQCSHSLVFPNEERMSGEAWSSA